MKFILKYGITNGTITSRDVGQETYNSLDEAKERLSEIVSDMAKIGYWLEWSKIDEVL